MKIINSIVAVCFFLNCYKTTSNVSEKDLNFFGSRLEELGVQKEIPDFRGNLRELKLQYRGFEVVFTEWNGEKKKFKELYTHKKYKKGVELFYDSKGYFKRSNLLFGDIGKESIIYGYGESGRQVEKEKEEILINCFTIGSSPGPIQCGKEYIFDSRGNLIKEKDWNIKCNNGCFEVVPYVTHGQYLSKGDKVRVRSEPSLSGKILFEINKNDPLEVIEDVGNIEQIGEDVAPWVKIKIPDGKEGYIFGVFVKKEGEFYP